MLVLLFLVPFRFILLLRRGCWKVIEPKAQQMAGSVFVYVRICTLYSVYTYMYWQDINKIKIILYACFLSVYYRHVCFCGYACTVWLGHKPTLVQYWWDARVSTGCCLGAANCGVRCEGGQTDLGSSVKVPASNACNRHEGSHPPKNNFFPKKSDRAGFFLTVIKDSYFFVNRYIS